MNFKPGDRIRVSEDHFWAKGATGTVAAFPGLLAENMTGALLDNATMSVPGRRGPIAQSWIVFDVPQIDGDGDGPYAAAAVDSGALTRLQ